MEGKPRRSSSRRSLEDKEEKDQARRESDGSRSRSSRSLGSKSGSRKSLASASRDTRSGSRKSLGSISESSHSRISRSGRDRSSKSISSREFLSEEDRQAKSRARRERNGGEVLPGAASSSSSRDLGSRKAKEDSNGPGAASSRSSIDRGSRKAKEDRNRPGAQAADTRSDRGSRKAREDRNIPGAEAADARSDPSRRKSERNSSRQDQDSRSSDRKLREERKMARAASTRATPQARVHHLQASESGRFEVHALVVDDIETPKRETIEEVSEEPEDMDGATLAQCVFNLSNILMGVGLLTLPYTCKVAGTIGGSIAITVLALITWRTSILIGRSLNGDPRPLSSFKDSPWKTPLNPGSTPEARMRKPISGFPDIAREAFGNFGSVLLAIVLYFELFSCIGIFLVSIGDHIHKLFPYHPVTVYMVGAAIFAAIPVILLRTARLLSYLSMVGTFATVCVVSSVVFSYVLEGDITERIAKHMPDSAPPFHGSFRPDGLPLAFGLCAYCFSGHAIVPSIFNSMQRPQDFEKVVNISFSIVLLCSFGVGLSGYFMFGDFVEDQVTLSLESYSSFHTAMTILTYLMILTAFSKLVLTMFPLALGIEEIFTPYLSTEKGVAVLSIVIKVVLLFGALMVAIFFPSFSLLCSMVGMICTMVVSVIFPAAAYIKLFGAKIGIFEKVLYGFFVLIGVAIAMVGTCLSIE